MPNRMLALSIVAAAVLSLCGCANDDENRNPLRRPRPISGGREPGQRRQKL